MRVEVHFHNMDPSAAVELAVREHAAKLERFTDEIMSCRITVRRPHRHQHQGGLYGATVDVRFRGGEVVASREPSAHHAHEDVYVALRDAFKAVRRQLQDRIRERRGSVKARVALPHGEIASLEPDKDCGRIVTADGREIYFHRNSVIDMTFDRLERGMEVRFSEELGDRGPQASSVHVIGKHHHRG